MKKLCSILFSGNISNNYRAKKEIKLWGDDYEQLQKTKDEKVKKSVQTRTVFFYICSTYHGIHAGGEYPVHKTVEIIRAIQFPIEAYEVSACQVAIKLSPILWQFYTTINVTLSS